MSKTSKTMQIKKLLYISTMLLPDDCASNRWCSEAMNVTHISLVRTFLEIGVENIIALSIRGSASLRNPTIFNRPSHKFLDPGIRLLELPYIALGPLQPVSHLLACTYYLLRMDNRPDAIIVGHPNLRLVLPAILAGKFWDIPVIIMAPELIDLVAQNLIHRLQRWAKIMAVRMAPGVAVFSSHLGRDFRGERPWIRIVRPPSTELLQPIGDIEAPTSGEKTNIIYYAGSTEILMGADLFLKATTLIKDPSYRFWFSGRGELDEAIHTAAEKDNRITHWGFVSREDYKLLLHKATVLINPRPSRVPENRYNFPSKLMEYMAVGQPIISTVTSDVAEYYSDAIVLLDVETPERLAELIQQVSDMSTEEQITLGQKARRHVENETWEAQAQLLLEFMESL